MGNSLRCCLACVIPCGALDLIRIVHLNGFVEEITHPVTAGDILKANPNHVLTKPCSQGVARKILILSPDSDLKRGCIYFLIPDASLPKTAAHRKKSTPIKTIKTVAKDQIVSESHREHKKTVAKDKSVSASHSEHKKTVANGKLSRREHHHHRRSGSRIEVWRPQLQSIAED